MGLRHTGVSARAQAAAAHQTVSHLPPLVQPLVPAAARQLPQGLRTSPAAAPALTRAASRPMPRPRRQRAQAPRLRLQLRSGLCWRRRCPPYLLQRRQAPRPQLTQSWAQRWQTHQLAPRAPWRCAQTRSAARRAGDPPAKPAVHAVSAHLLELSTALYNGTVIRWCAKLTRQAPPRDPH